MELQPRLQLVYENGQFTFSRFAPTATPAQLFELAECINAFQVPAAYEVRRIRTIAF
jgi:hypothetical protein